MTRPRVIYEAKPGSPLDVDRALYERLAGEAGTRSLVERFVVPRRSGRAWPVRAGQLFRIVAAEGPQVADLNVWNLDNPRERFWAARTRQLHRAHLTTFDRLWSCLPYLRPMLTITRDSIQYGRDADGGGCHDLLGTRCDPYVHKLLNGEEFDLCCHSNLVRAVAPYHLTELDVHDVLNVFQVTGLTADGRYFVKPSPSRAGDFIE
ncbi:MAG TPA: urea carboxylase-associated family protein, partial [Candidatus Binatia bacterium]|nr:urea carboxylase-associated family protein [Candidatus Binatia bacterium]